MTGVRTHGFHTSGVFLPNRHLLFGGKLPADEPRATSPDAVDDGQWLAVTRYSRLALSETMHKRSA